MSEAHIERAVKRLKVAAESSEQIYHKPLMVCYSGGKDSQILVSLAVRAGIPFEMVHNLTTVDAPETVYTVRETVAALESMGIPARVSKPDLTMWELIPKMQMPPTRVARYCCKYLKERKTNNTFIATGVRSSESTQRKSRSTFESIEKKKQDRERFGDVFLSNDNDERRRTVEHCMAKREMCVNPILDWTDAQAFDYFWNECKIHNPLYEVGFYRVGCIGCPLSSRRNRLREFKRWPKYRDAYIRAFDKMLAMQRARGKEPGWKDADEVFEWWMDNPNGPNQLQIDWEEADV